MVLLATCIVLQTQSSLIERDSFGVPHIKVASEAEAFRLQGFATAQDRLWQMETTRRIARGKMAEIMGPTSLASDKEFAAQGYTDQEFTAMFDRQDSKWKAAVESYAQGVNDYISEAKSSNRLPKQYAAYEFLPEPWTKIDTAAICVYMARLFGSGGAGELRNYALFLWLLSQPCKERAIDVFDDLAWFNDPRSICTVSDSDDPLRANHVKFPIPTREQTLAHVSSLPKASAIELLPAIRLASLEQTRYYAELNSTLFKTGSYAIVVGKNRSRTGYPLLLSGPQMGHTSPSVIHQVHIDSSTYRAEGMSVPGIPGVLVGATPTTAWGLTTGVADSSDIFYYPADKDNYEFDGKRIPFETARFSIRVKGSTVQSVEQKRTNWGPVILESTGGKCAYVKRSAIWKSELDGFATSLELQRDFSTARLNQLAPTINANFNIFYATVSGDIGWRFCGSIPIRPAGNDPRLPILASTKNDWQGFIPAEKMPHVTNPKSGLIANWNNKPVSWWPNGDTPVWGRLFRNQSLVEQLTNAKLGLSDLERSIWAIARRDDATMAAFVPLTKHLDLDSTAALNELRAFDGWRLDGSTSATLYSAFVDALREEVFYPSTGNFLSAANARQILQPSALLNAIERKTKFDYYQGRSLNQIVKTSFEKSVQKLGSDESKWRFKTGGIAVPDQSPIPYTNRGTYIQILELRRGSVFGRNIASPGISESGSHAYDQVPLARSWMYRPMRLFPAP